MTFETPPFSNIFIDNYFRICGTVWNSSPTAVIHAAAAAAYTSCTWSTPFKFGVRFDAQESTRKFICKLIPFMYYLPFWNAIITFYSIYNFSIFLCLFINTNIWFYFHWSIFSENSDCCDRPEHGGERGRGHWQWMGRNWLLHGLLAEHLLGILAST